MLKLDNSLLDELGLGGLPEDQKRAMLQHIYDTLELRVGTNLANQMTDQQLEEFEQFIDDGGDANQAQALQWLEANLPNYKQVVNDVFEALKVEIKQMVPQIMATSVPQQSAMPPQQQTALEQNGRIPEQMPPVRQPDPLPPTSQPVPMGTMPNPAGYSPQSPALQPPSSASGQDAQAYQFPTQQPPAGPGGYRSSQHPDDQRRSA